MCSFKLFLSLHFLSHISHLASDESIPSLILSLQVALSSSSLTLSSSLHLILKLFPCFSHFSEYFFFSVFLIFSNYLPRASFAFVTSVRSLFNLKFSSESLFRSLVTILFSFKTSSILSSHFSFSFSNASFFT